MHCEFCIATLRGAHCQVLAKNPADRLSLDAVMRHPWIAPCSPQPLLPRRPSQVRRWRCTFTENTPLTRCKPYFALLGVLS